jgi:hypothetical protein
MFGLSDNADKNNVDTTQVSASDSAALPPLTTNVPDDNSLPNSNSGPLAPGVDVAAPATFSAADTASPSASSMPPGPAVNSSAGGIGDVNLENAYISTDPPQISKTTSTLAKPPTAASLLKNSGEDELLKLKQQALQSLAPLVDHLNQSNEEKFKTTMMLIQASDNADLIPEAYEAANKIEDEKVRAQALLDVVNEINYFTQQTHSDNK